MGASSISSQLFLHQLILWLWSFSSQIETIYRFSSLLIHSQHRWEKLHAWFSDIGSVAAICHILLPGSLGGGVLHKPTGVAWGLYLFPLLVLLPGEKTWPFLPRLISDSPQSDEVWYYNTDNYLISMVVTHQYVWYWRFRDLVRSGFQWTYTICLVIIHIFITFFLPVPGCPR